MIKVENITKKYGDKRVLEKFNYTFPDSGFVAINGRSGIGKTTLLNIIMGTETPDEGRVYIQKNKEFYEKNTKSWENKFQNSRFCKDNTGTFKNNFKISTVFQENRLLEYDTVIQNILFVMNDDVDSENKKNAKIIKYDNMEKASEILGKLGLENELNEKISNLSGGMKRRVAIARCLAVDADAYIMDEPIKGLDKDMSRKVLDIIHDYTDKNGKLLILVTHNPEETVGCTDLIDFYETTSQVGVLMRRACT